MAAARQLVNHGHITVDGKEVNIASFSCKPGQQIGVHAHKQSRRMVTEELDRGASEVPQHLTLQKSALSAVVNGIVNRADIQLTVNELLIVEFYSRKV